MSRELEDLARALYDKAIEGIPRENMPDHTAKMVARVRIEKVLARWLHPAGEAPKPFVLDREMVRGSLQELAEHINQNYCPPGWGFIAMIFEFGENENLQWVSNAQREDAIKLIREFADHLEKRQAGGPGDDPGSVL